MKFTVDKVLDSCFQLLSLFYLTIGRNNEAPAAYALTSTIKRLLDHVKEVDLYSGKDLDSLSARLDELANNIKQAHVDPSPDMKHSPYLLELLQERVERCQDTTRHLHKRLERIATPLHPVYEKCISILRQTSYANTKSKFSTHEVEKLRKQLAELDEQRKDGKFVSEDGTERPGSEELSEVLFRCSKWSEIVLDRYVW